MDSHHLLDNEQIITQSDGNPVSLTNLRLRYNDTQWGKAHIISFLLEKVSSVEIHYRSKTFLLIIAILAIAGGLIAGANGDEEFIGIGLGAGLLFIILYFVSRRLYLTISSDSGDKIHFHIKGMKRDKVLNFINQLESAIRQRREELK